jgi:transcription antitermination protein NusB
VRRTDQRRAAVFIGYQRDVTGAQLEDLVERSASGSTGDVEGPEIPREPTAFTRELVEGVEARREELDDLLEEQAVDWHVERIAPLERAILRVALYEMLYRSDVPDEVAIDEAVETSKLYCGSQAPGFVNGILGGIQRRVRHA